MVEAQAGMNGRRTMLRGRSAKTDESLPLQEGSPMSTTLAEPLTAADRCDRCSAAAKVRASLPSGGELLFCRHHFTEHEARLAEMGATVDQSAAELV